MIYLIEDYIPQSYDFLEKFTRFVTNLFTPRRGVCRLRYFLTPTSQTPHYPQTSSFKSFDFYDKTKEKKVGVFT